MWPLDELVVITFEPRFVWTHSELNALIFHQTAEVRKAVKTRIEAEDTTITS
jgi:hypothetical protein